MKKLLTLFLALAASVVMMNAAETIEAYTYSAPSIAVNGVPYTGEWAEKKVVFQYNGTDEAISLSNLSDNYYSYIKAIYPAPESTAIDNTVVTEKATKRLVNGLLLIEYNGKTYNATGVRVRSFLILLQRKSVQISDV